MGTISRRKFIKNAAMGGLGLGFAPGMFDNAHQEQPNILWIVSEDNSSSYIGCYGNERATTPNIDQLASEGILYKNAFAPAPVCAPTRSSLITGVFANSMGTQHMRSTYPIPEFIHFYPYYLRKAGYYCINRAKKDYNTIDQQSVWNESSQNATYRNRSSGQPFFAIINLETTHESRIHGWTPVDKLNHDPENMPIPVYLPDTPEVKHDLAQYYDKMQEMDEQVGAILDRLKKDKLVDNTIVFYYSDHGGVLPRSKRFVFDSGLKVPLIIRFPEKYQNMAPGKPSTTMNHTVSFVDFPPTLLSLAGIDIPSYYQGSAFLGSHKQAPSRYAYGFRGRMDETYDKSRTVRDESYRYIRNYMPNRLYGQHIRYLWKAASMQSWEKAYKRGRLNDLQAKFWHTKSSEELYDIQRDPDNVHNLAGDPDYKNVLKRMRKANASWIRRIHDSGFMPEAMMVRRAQKANTSIYQYVRSSAYPQEKIISMAEVASMGNPKNLKKLMAGFTDSDAAVRFWAAYGCAILKKKAMPAKQGLMNLSNDPAPEVAIAASEALYYVGEKSKSLDRLKKALDNDDDKVRLLALNVLRTFGAGAMPLLPELEALEQKSPPAKGDSYGMGIFVTRYMIRQLLKDRSNGKSPY